MEIRDGFIVSIFNHCDRWCERCSLTSRCRLFADSAEWDFEEAQGPLTEPKAELDARELAPHGISFEEIEKEAEKQPDDPDRFEPKLEHLELRERAMDFGAAARKWLEGRSSDDAAVQHALEVIAHFVIFVPPKVHRALCGIRDDDEWGSCGDTEGSAKAALLALERMRAAWESMIDRRYLQRDSVASFIDRAGWLIRELERVVPDARAFVRPGFDEPDALAQLDAAD